MWKCSKCGAECEDKFCGVCGEPMPEEPVEETADETIDETVEEILEDEAQEIALEEIFEEDIPEIVNLADEKSEIETETKYWICPTCSVECDGDVCLTCGEPKPAESNIVNFAPKKKNKKLMILAIVIAIVVLLTAGIFVYYLLNKTVEPTGEDNKVTYNDLMDACDSIRDDSVALIINDVEVPASIFEGYLSNSALMYQQEYCFDETGNFDVKKLDEFDWNAVADEKTKETHLQKVVASTVNNCVEYYSIIALGEKHNIKPTEENIASIDQYIDQNKQTYGDKFNDILKLNGYSSLDQFKDLLMVDIRSGAVYEDIQAHPDRYINEDLSVYNFENPSSISAKHILIMIDEENGVTEADAKKQAEEVLKAIKDGKDFDKLIDEYNQDSGQPAEGYTFGKGQMVKEFEEAAFKLKANEISDIVKTDFGFHIIKRIIGPMDVINYEKANAEIRVNKGYIEELKINVDLKELQKAAQQQ